MERITGNPESELLLQNAAQLIENEPNPITRGTMIVAATQEGMPLSADDVLSTLGEIPDDERCDPATISPFRQKMNLAADAVRAFAHHERFADADRLVNYLEALDAYSYIDAVTTLLGQGYAGPDNRYLRLTAEQIFPQARQGESAQSQRMQRSYLEAYMCGIARYGIDVMRPGTEYSEILFTINSMRTAIQEDARDPQRRVSNLAHAYAAGGHIDLAISYKSLLADHNIRARTCAVIAEQSTDPAIVDNLIQEMIDLQIEISSCNAACGNQYCAPANAEIVRLRTLRLQIQSDAEFVKVAMHEQPGNYSSEQLQIHLGLYEQLGDDESRGRSLQLINRIASIRTPEALDGYMRRIAMADYLHNKVLPSTIVGADEEYIPLLSWEIERAYSAVDVYMQSLTGHSLSATEQAIGAMTSVFGEQAIDIDLELCLEQRDRAYATIATVLAKTGAPESAQRFLRKIDDPTTKVRGLVAVAQTLAA